MNTAIPRPHRRPVHRRAQAAVNNAAANTPNQAALPETVDDVPVGTGQPADQEHQGRGWPRAPCSATSTAARRTVPGSYRVGPPGDLLQHGGGDTVGVAETRRVDTDQNRTGGPVQGGALGLTHRERRLVEHLGGDRQVCHPEVRTGRQRQAQGGQGRTGGAGVGQTATAWVTARLAGPG